MSEIFSLDLVFALEFGEIRHSDVSRPWNVLDFVLTNLPSCLKLREVICVYLIEHQQKLVATEYLLECDWVPNSVRRALGERVELETACLKSEVIRTNTPLAVEAVVLGQGLSRKGSHGCHILGGSVALIVYS